IARTFRGVARWWLGRPGWRQDLDDAVEMARNSDPTTMALVVAWTQLSLMYGVLRLDDAVLRMVEESTAIAEACSNDFAVMGAKFTLGTTLLFRDDVAERHRGEDLMVLARDESLPVRAPSLVPVARLMVAREGARRGDL
ncbi:cyclase, partial [Mycobacterium sp. ITM-2017-0098]